MTSARSGNAARASLVAVSLAVLLWAAFGAAQPGAEFVHHRRLSVKGLDGEAQPVALIVPRRPDRAMAPPEGRYALVVALHDLRGAERGPSKGPMIWSVNFELPVAFGALERGRLERRDFNGFVSAEHLAAVNAKLAGSPFLAPVIVSPYVPDLSGATDEDLSRYADWLVEVVLPAVRDSFEGVAHGRDGTGIDGIGLGGRVALEVGLRKPEVFSAVGAIQPMLDTGSARAIAERAKPEAGQAIRLVTSEEDPARSATLALSAAFRERSMPHALVDTPGTHDIEYGRGAGAIELLRFHTAALVREPAPN
jgi:iron(III)-salmochelin esterase